MKKSAKFWGEIRGKQDRALEMPWNESLSKELRGTITNVKEFNITEETLEIKLRKGKIRQHLEQMVFKISGGTS